MSNFPRLHSHRMMKGNHNQRLFRNCYFWHSRQKQETDYLEELNGSFRGYEIKWRETELKRIGFLYLPQSSAEVIKDRV